MLWYASGPCRETTGKPASAFSKGDILMLNSNSSLSRIPTSSASVGALATGLVYAIAKADSIESIADLVPVVIALPETVFWSDATIGSSFTKGERVDVEYTGGTFRLTTSAISAMLIIDPNGDDSAVVDSASSRRRVSFDPDWTHYRS